MLFLRIQDTLSGLDLLAAVYLASTYLTYPTYIGIRRNFLDRKIIISYMRDCFFKNILILNNKFAGMRNNFERQRM